MIFERTLTVSLLLDTPIRTRRLKRRFYLFFVKLPPCRARFCTLDKALFLRKLSSGFEQAAN